MESACGTERPQWWRPHHHPAVRPAHHMPLCTSLGTASKSQHRWTGKRAKRPIQPLSTPPEKVSPVSCPPPSLPQLNPLPHSVGPLTRACRYFQPSGKQWRISQPVGRSQHLDSGQECCHRPCCILLFCFFLITCAFSVARKSWKKQNVIDCYELV